MPAFATSASPDFKNISSIASAYTVDYVGRIKELQKDSGQLADFNIEAVHTWAEVRLAAGLTASQTYQAKAAGHSGIARLLGRKIGDMRFAIDPIATTLPAGDYTSLVCGGLVLLFKAFGRAAEIRDKITDDLQDYPILLEQAQAYTELYPDDERLKLSMLHLYVGLLETVEGMISYFCQSKWHRLKALPQQNLYGREVETKIDALHRTARTFREEADLCVHNKLQTLAVTVNAIDETTVCIAESTANIHDATRRIEQRSDEIYDSTKQSADLLEAISRSQAQTHQGMLEGAARLSDLEKAGSLVVDELRKLRSERFEAAQPSAGGDRQRYTPTDLIGYARSEPIYPRGPMAYEWPVKRLHQNDILSMLSTRPLQQPPSSTKADHGEIDSLFEAAKFRSWASSAHSQLLFVVETDSSTSKKGNPSGADSASTIAAIIRLAFPRDTVVAQTCGPGDDAASVFENLVQQLLISQEFEMGGWCADLSLQDHMAYIRQRNLSYLCGLLGYLMERQQTPTVHFLVGNMAVLEQNISEQDIQDLLGYFRSIVATTSTRSAAAQTMILGLGLRQRSRIVETLRSEELLRLGKHDGVHQELTEKQRIAIFQSARRRKLLTSG